MPQELASELKIVTSAVERNGGEIIALSPAQYMNPELAAALQDIKALAAGPSLRPEGLTLYSTQTPPSEETLRELMNIHALDRWQSRTQINFFRTAHDAQPVWGDAKRLYHSSTMLDYVVMRHVGWVDPMDREWFLERATGIGMSGVHYGFSLSWSLSDSLEYGGSSGGGSFAEQLYRACGRKLPSALQALGDQSIILGMPASGLKSAFPTGKVLWKGFEKSEVCCPLLPADIPEVGLAPIAIITWNPRPSI
jgi:hypothetical protein